MRFSVLATCGPARRGRLELPRGTVDTPAFMPVGTRGTVRGLTPRQVAETGAQIVLANTYHLALRPGADVVRELGGLPGFTGWDGPFLTDSGGFQVMSLADRREVTEEGVRFSSHVDGAEVFLGPEEAVRIQESLGADVAMVLDECPALPADDEAVRRAMERTIRWARRSKEAHSREDQVLFGIVQGGTDLDLRDECRDAICSIGFPGYAIGGLSVGESPEEMERVVRHQAPSLPAGAPRYLMGVGRPSDIVRAVGAGVDLFDCVMPTRNARNAYFFTREGPVRIKNATHRRSTEPIDPACDCYTCRTAPRGYLRHLYKRGEMLGPILGSLHNLAFYHDLIREGRAAIEEGTYPTWAEGTLARLREGD